MVQRDNVVFALVSCVMAKTMIATGKQMTETPQHAGL